MQNNLVNQLSQNKETFKECRIFMVQQLGKTKEQILAIEDGLVTECVPYYIKYIESKGLSMNEIVGYYYNEDLHNLPYWNLLLASINGTFKKIENNDLNFIPF